jgi:maleate isomerase
MMRYGSRAKLGYLIPSVNLASECQFPAMAPPGVSLHFTRLKLVSANEEDLRRMADGLEPAVELLQDAGVTSITFHCTAVTTFAPGMDEKLIQRRRLLPAGRLSRRCRSWRQRRWCW